jgi:hypothetical protein
MSFIEGVLEDSPRGAVFRAPAGLHFPAPLDGCPRGPAVLGVRAAALQPAEREGPGVIAAEVLALELVGERLDVVGRTGAGTLLRARLERRGPWAPGQAVLLRIDPAGVRYFEPGPEGRALAPEI